jgi:HD superfamily phosphodiesterase
MNMKREEILKEIRSKCKEMYLKVPDWNHGIYHVKRVVKNGIKLAEAEKLKSKDRFLVELACWLHDLGRAYEEKGLDFKESDHAEQSYFWAKKILRPYMRKMGRESVYKVLQAVREHSDAVLRHKTNVIARILQDADRGATISILGVFSVLHHFGVIQVGLIKTKKQGREEKEMLTKYLKKRGEIQEALNKINDILVFYYGREEVKPKRGAKKVQALHTESAKKLFKKDIEEVENYVGELRSIL